MSIFRPFSAVSLKNCFSYVLTGEVWEVPEDNILAQLILGGEPVNDEDMGYGPARLIPKEIVSRLSTAMEKWDMEKFRARFDIKDMIENEIYTIALLFY